MIFTPEREPKRPKMLPKMPKDAAKTAQDAPKIPPRCAQGAPKRAQAPPRDAPGGLQDAIGARFSAARRSGTILNRFWDPLGPENTISLEKVIKKSVRQKQQIR